MKVTRFLSALFVCCTLISGASADDRYKTGTPTLAQPRATLQAPTTSTRPTYQTAQSPRPAAPVGSAPLAVPAPRNIATLRTESAPTVPAAPEAEASTPHVPLSMSQLNPTPDMWYYERMREDYENPTLQVRRNSEQYAADRKARIAASAWYGVYNSRPMAYVTPHTYQYSPTFAPNARFPYLWGQTPASRVYLQSRRNYMGVDTW
ncbi:MAG: hypothetical protein QM775_05210 [Pirellulales bacterium]